MKKNSPQKHFFRHKVRHIWVKKNYCCLRFKWMTYTEKDAQWQQLSNACSEYWKDGIIIKLRHLLANRTNNNFSKYRGSLKKIITDHGTVHIPYIFRIFQRREDTDSIFLCEHPQSNIVTRIYRQLSRFWYTHPKPYTVTLEKYSIFLP